MRTGSTKTIVNFREGPSLDHRIKTTFPAKTKVTVLEEQDDWLRVSVNAQEGFVNASLVNLVEADKRSTAVTIGFPRLRTSPGYRSNVITTLEPQTIVVILEERDHWVKVSVNGQEGFIHSSLVR